MALASMSSTPHPFGHIAVTLAITTREPLDFTCNPLKKKLKFMPQKSSSQSEGRKIKQLARLNGGFPQSYPHKWWTLRDIFGLLACGHPRPQ
jgi:hypothetical protein